LSFIDGREKNPKEIKMFSDLIRSEQSGTKIAYGKGVRETQYFYNLVSTSGAMPFFVSIKKIVDSSAERISLRSHTPVLT